MDQTRYSPAEDPDQAISLAEDPFGGSPAEPGEGPPSPAVASDPVQPELAYEPADAAEVFGRDEDVADTAGSPMEAPPLEETSEDEPSPEDDPSLDQMVESLRTAAETVGTVSSDAVPEAAAVALESASTETGPETQDAEPEAAPEPSQTVDAGAAIPAAALEPILARDRAGTQVPYWLFAAAWATFSVVMTVLLWPMATDSFVGRPLYAVFVYGGAGMTLAAPILGLLVWAIVRAGVEPDLRQGLLRAALLRAATTAVFGVVVWWVALVVLDLHRAGLLG